MIMPFYNFLPAGLRVAQPPWYCFYSVVQKWVFHPAGAARCPNKREIWHSERTTGCRRKSVMFFCLFVCHALELQTL